MSNNIEVHIDFAWGQKRVGTLYRHPRSGGEALSFEYHQDWLNDKAARFSLEPALRLTPGAFAPTGGMSMFGSIGDSAPDTWGRRLMQRAERRLAEQEGRAIRTLMEADYLLGVSDISRSGALRFRQLGEPEFQSPKGVPQMIALGELLGITERILRDEDTAEDLQLIFAPGSSLGGARPKASVQDVQGQLVVAKFPKETDDYSLETWEVISLELAKQAGLNIPQTRLETVAGKPILLSYRFDRSGNTRIPFLSALSLMGLKDGERGSYLEIVDVLTQYGAQCKTDAQELYRRMVFNVLISNVDDHLRNHGFLWQGQDGWVLSPVYDLNPTPVDVRPRILTTNISLDEATCDIELALSVAEYFNLSQGTAKTIIREVAVVTSTWSLVAGKFGLRSAEIKRMESAFEHEDLKRALKI